MRGSTLHTIASSWHESIWLFEQLAFANDGDTILLIQDAVLACHSPLSLGSFVAKCHAKGVALTVLTDDLKLRGVQNQYDGIQSIDYSGFVALVEQHDKQIAW